MVAVNEKLIRQRNRKIACALTASCAWQDSIQFCGTNFAPSLLRGETRSLGSVDQNGNTLKYDAWNRLVSVTNSAGQLIASYTYNALSQRVTETYPIAAPGIPANTVKNPGAAAQPRHPASAGFRGIDKSPAQSAAGAAPLNLYYSTGGQILEERWGGTAASNTQYQYVWSATYVNAMVLRDTFTAGAIQPDLRIYTTNDANSNVTSLITYNAATQTWGVSERFVYSPYGSVLIFDASFTSIPDAFNWQYMYQGGRFDTATGLYHFGARNYSPSLGIWISQDPAVYINGANTYQFVGSSPINLTDENGLVHGNSITDTRPNIVYEIREPDGRVYKWGISGTPPNSSGDYPRLQRQLNQLNRGLPSDAEKYSGRIIGKTANRADALQAEQDLLDNYYVDTGGKPRGMELPNPTDEAKAKRLARLKEEQMQCDRDEADGDGDGAADDAAADSADGADGFLGFLGDLFDGALLIFTTPQNLGSGDMVYPPIHHSYTGGISPQLMQPVNIPFTGGAAGPTTAP